jgi:hypothetical protein
MKYAIPQDRLDKVVFKYLDMQYGDLEIVKANYYNIILKRINSDSKYGIMGYDEKPKTLYIHYKLIREISEMFFIEYSDSENVIGRWVENRFQIQVNKAKRRG